MLRLIFVLGSVVAITLIVPALIIVLSASLLILLLLLAATAVLPVILRIRSSVVLILIVGVVLLVHIVPILLVIALLPLSARLILLGTAALASPGSPGIVLGGRLDGDRADTRDIEEVRVGHLGRLDGDRGIRVVLPIRSVVDNRFDHGIVGRDRDWSGRVMASLRGRILVITFTRRLVVCHGKRSSSGSDARSRRLPGTNGGYSWII